VIRTEVPADRLVTPDTVRGSHATPVESVREQGWPALGALRGRIVFVLHTDSEIDALYVAGDPSLSGRVMFSSSGPRELRDDAVFVIHNDPAPESIRELTGERRIVRTRADADTEVIDAKRVNALQSRAQIVSTDYPSGSPNDAAGVVEFAPGKTLLQDVSYGEDDI
jgi:hypothetical protein